MSHDTSTLDMSGFLQLSKSGFAPRSNVNYAELHGTMLYYWSERPRNGVNQQPLSVLNVDKAEVEEVPNAKLAVLVKGPHLAKPVTLTFSAEREKSEWFEKLRAPVVAHTKVIPAQQPQDSSQQQQEQEDGSSTLFSRSGHKKVSLDDFELIQVLGAGAFGQVLQVQKKDTGEQFAMKMMNKKMMSESSSLAQFPIERSILESMKHPFIVSLQFAFQTNEFLYIVMDLLAGGELFFHLEQCGTFDEPRARFYAAEIGLAIGYLHSKHIIYRDLKPENVVLDSCGHACLTDFGLAKANIGSGVTANTFCGTAEYQAPEFLLGNPHDRAVDWWSLGIMLYEMIFGIPPFYDENNTKMSELILEGDLTFDKNGMSASPEAQDLMTRLLDRDPKTRMQSVEEFKKHPFFKGIDFDKLYHRKIAPPFVPDANPVNNFNSEFTGLAIPIEEHNSGKAHPNVAGFTYDRSDEFTPAGLAALPAQPPTKAAGITASSLSAQQKRGSTASNTASGEGKSLSLAPAAAAKKSTASSASSSPKAKPSSPTGKKGAVPPPHLVAKVPPRRPS